MKKSILIAFIIAALFLGAFWGSRALQEKSLGFGDSTFSATTVVTRNIASLGTTQFVASDARRKFLSIQNHATNTIFCVLDGDITLVSSSVTSTALAEVGFRIYGVASGTPSYFSILGYVGGVNCAAEARVTSTVITSP